VNSGDTFSTYSGDTILDYSCRTDCAVVPSAYASSGGHIGDAISALDPITDRVILSGVAERSTNRRKPYLSKRTAIMGANIFLQAHVDGGSQEIPTKDVLDCFSGFIAAQEDTFIEVVFANDDSCTIFMDTTASTIDSLMVSRPCSEDVLGPCLFRVMKLGNFVLFAPGLDGFIASNEEVIGHMPDGMAEDLGEARIASDLASFMRALTEPLVLQ